MQERNKHVYTALDLIYSHITVPVRRLMKMSRTDVVRGTDVVGGTDVFEGEGGLTAWGKTRNRPLMTKRRRLKSRRVRRNRK